MLEIPSKDSHAGLELLLMACGEGRGHMLGWMTHLNGDLHGPVRQSQREGNGLKSIQPTLCSWYCPKLRQEADHGARVKAVALGMLPVAKAPCRGVTALTLPLGNKFSTAGVQVAHQSTPILP